MINFETIREGDIQPPPSKADEPTALEFISAVLASAVGTRTRHCTALIEAAREDPAVAQLFNFVGLPAAYSLLSSLHHSQRVTAPAPGSNAIKRVPNTVTRTGGRRGSAG
eukprot:5628760-Pleurochrysis_carterae.AAC.1